MAHLINRGIFLASVGLLAGLTGVLLAQSSSSDMQFAKEAALGGMTEVELGKIAVQKASNEKVREFGQRMVDDHSKAGDELKSIAAKDNLTLPSDLDAKHKAMVDRFSKLSAGPGFDREYIRDMVKDHQTDIADFEKEANNGQNPDLKTWVNNTLPTLREHLRLAEDAQRSIGTTTSSSLGK